MPRGFTLIEVMAAVAILAVVAVMSVQTLGGVMLHRDILLRQDDQAAELLRSLALLRRDFEAAAPLTDAGARNGLLGDAQGVTLLRGGLADLPGVAAGVQRLRWAVVGGALTRQLGADAAVVMLRGVQGFGVSPVQATGDTLPPGFEIRLESARFGAIRLVVAR